MGLQVGGDPSEEQTRACNLSDVFLLLLFRAEQGRQENRFQEKVDLGGKIFSFFSIIAKNRVMKSSSRENNTKYLSVHLIKQMSLSSTFTLYLPPLCSSAVCLNICIEIMPVF